MIRIFSIAALSLFSGNTFFGQTIKEAYNNYFVRSDITTISEQFKGLSQTQGNRLILTSDPESRDGMFFILNVDSIASTHKIRIHYITTESIEADIKEFNLSNVPHKKWLYLGLTGSDWKDETLKVLAWKIDLLDSEDNIQDEWKSFLWEKNSSSNE